GIRDLIVTGVQTCALPILRARGELLPDVAGKLDGDLVLADRWQVEVDQKFRQARQAGIARDLLQVMRDRGAQERRDRQIGLDRGDRKSVVEGKSGDNGGGG